MGERGREEPFGPPRGKKTTPSGTARPDRAGLAPSRGSPNSALAAAANQPNTTFLFLHVGCSTAFAVSLESNCVPDYYVKYILSIFEVVLLRAVARSLFFQEWMRMLGWAAERERHCTEEMTHPPCQIHASLFRSQ